METLIKSETWFLMYGTLDWNGHPGMSAAFVCGTVVVFPIIMGVFYYLAKFRDFLWAKYYVGGVDEDSIPTSTGKNTKANEIYTISIKLQDQ